MELDIRAGKRILYKLNGKWNIGKLTNLMAPNLTEKGLFVFVIPKDYMDAEKVPYLHDAEINDIFLESKPVEDWMRQYGYLMTKDEYIEHIQSEDFDHKLETGYVSDGEYYYYPVGSYNKTWLMKQPFDYIVRNDNGI